MGFQNVEEPELACEDYSDVLISPVSPGAIIQSLSCVINLKDLPPRAHYRFLADF
jgi:hypothetical protein